MDLTRRQLLRSTLLLTSGGLLTGTLASCASSPPEPAAQPTAEPVVDPIDAYIAAEMAKRRIPGLALAVVQRGKTIKSQPILRRRTSSTEGSLRENPRNRTRNVKKH